MDFKKIRNDIDSIDSELISLFEKRMELAAEIGRYKLENNLPILNKEREEEILNAVVSCVKPELGEYAKALYETIFSISRSYQQSLFDSDAKE